PPISTPFPSTTLFRSVLRYGTQMIHQEGLFFVLPFLYTATTWNSGQALFTGLVGAAALIALVDPLYFRWLSTRRWVFLTYHTFTDRKSTRLNSSHVKI